MKCDILQDFLNVYNKINNWEEHSLPLCAAENITSNFVRLPKTTFLQEKYILGGTLNYNNNNFFGSENLYEIYSLVQKQCNKMFNCLYSDARTLSGINAIVSILMCLFNVGDTVMITSPDYGGHSSIPVICDRLGLNVIYIPYDYENKDFDYPKINAMLKEMEIKGLLIALSDMIEQPQLHKINASNEIILYDATQILGLIATGCLENPFNWFSENKNFILLGATHKTIPGPTSGLIMTNNLKLAKTFDSKINPDYLRNVQLDNIVGLLFALLELEHFGCKYFLVMQNLLNVVAKNICNSRITVIKTREGRFSNTHQLWLSIDQKYLDDFEKNAILARVSLNIRKRKIYGYSGVRLGFQQIARYNWNNKDAEIIAKILDTLCSKTYKQSKLLQLLNLLSSKKVHFTFDDQTIKNVYDVLHNSNVK